MNASANPPTLATDQKTQSQLAFYRKLQAHLVPSADHLREQEIARLRPMAMRFAVANQLDALQWERVYRLSLQGVDLNLVLYTIAHELINEPAREGS